MGELVPFKRRRQFAADQARIMVWLGLLIGLLAYQALRFTQPPFPPPASGASSPADNVLIRPAVVQVIDGDTFDHGGMRVRIADIDAPEVDGRCPYETDLAERATNRLRALLAGGDIALRPSPDGRDEDPYGRKLRIVTGDGRSVGDMLVAEGLARAWAGRREPWCGPSTRHRRLLTPTLLR